MFERRELRDSPVQPDPRPVRGRGALPETDKALSNARRVSFDLNERFGYPVAETLRRAEGHPRALESQVPGRLVQPDRRQPSDIDRDLSDANDVREALRGQILGRVRSRGLPEKPDRIDEYLRLLGLRSGL